MQDQYSYDANGNVTAIADQQESGVFNRAMTYDDLDRLWTANAPGVWGNATYTYDAVDNLLTATVGSRSSTLNYDASNRLSSTSTNGSTANYSYDARGNISSKGGQSFAFRPGQPAQQREPGRRLQLRRPRAALSGEQQRRQHPLAALQPGRPDPLGHQQRRRAAVRQRGLHLPGRQADCGVEQRKRHAIRAHRRTGQPGGAHQRIRRPDEPQPIRAIWLHGGGRKKPGPSTSSIGFTGHVNDSETDLVYMQQRYYDPIAGRFLSVDPVVTDANTGKGAFFCDRSRAWP